MPTEQKAEIVAEVSESIQQANSVWLTDYKGLNVEEINELRRAFSNASVQYRVVKNTLARISMKSSDHENMIEYLEGPTAIAFGMDDPAAPAKVLKEFNKKDDKVQIKACLFEGVLIGTDKLEEIANLPTKQELLGQLVGVLNAPLSNLVHSLGAITSKLVYALDAVKTKKEESN